MLFSKVKPFVYLNGGNIIMVQIENEYGLTQYCDKAYMGALVDLVKECLHPDIFLFVTEPPFPKNMECGQLPSDGFVICDYASWEDPTAHLKAQWAFNGHGPYAVSEDWTGWIDIWGTKHQKRDPHKIAQYVELILSMNGSINFYMFVGGTNWGFLSGAEVWSNSYTPIITSYDFDAPLSEGSADMRYKYQLLQPILRRYNPHPQTYDVSNTTKGAYGNVTFHQSLSLFDAIPFITWNHSQSTHPLLFEDLNVPEGYVLYRTTTKGGVLHLTEVRDRAYIYVDEKYHDFVDGHKREHDVKIPAGRLDILVENKGRITYENEYDETKGLRKGVFVDGYEHTGWEHFGFDVNMLSGSAQWKPVTPHRNAGFYRGEFTVDKLGDTWLNTKGLWKKGFAMVNNHNMGRYWDVGPQVSLFVPSEFLKVGVNEVIVFEAENQHDEIGTMAFEDHANLGP
jgi:beta-galactosidase GanA